MQGAIREPKTNDSGTSSGFKCKPKCLCGCCLEHALEAGFGLKRPFVVTFPQHIIWEAQGPQLPRNAGGTDLSQNKPLMVVRAELCLPRIPMFKY